MIKTVGLSFIKLSFIKKLLEGQSVLGDPQKKGM